LQIAAAESRLIDADLDIVLTAISQRWEIRKDRQLHGQLHGWDLY